MTKKYDTIFFDLDRTLWDFDTNSKLTLMAMFNELSLQSAFGSFLFFYEHYLVINRKLWLDYYNKKISKKKLSYTRFYDTLLQGGVDNLALAKKMGKDYVELSPFQTVLFPNTHKILSFLKNKHYDLNIITNGFNEVQSKKLKNCDLSKYFSHLITSEDAGQHKPKKEIFDFALEKVLAKPETSIMIGDDPITDIAGAASVGMDTIFFNHRRRNDEKVEATFEVYDLEELTGIF